MQCKCFSNINDIERKTKGRRRNKYRKTLTEYTVSN
ncbi:hypothetical protein CLOBOL_04125 [Enterocloster bolteae ATCC BAA-613]|uniref:Uncharacterized protein n=1 Tax=Enterocloster bolteae (strain ATCC BAA-613 / DSM 15670 / CCUG 46953 / JCM 12243 / WAL 16351) TaxID=411902 RepID=A8RUU7_ENTBW|nr:hypothetical protein CLOBOL_04125 [Enterocloster bolteae ATCC BAA-613]